MDVIAMLRPFIIAAMFALARQLWPWPKNPRRTIAVAPRIRAARHIRAVR